MKEPVNYVDNQRLLAELSVYREEYLEYVEKGLDKKPQLPHYVTSCILLIAKNLASLPNFAGYPYIDDMISDGIENCVLYIHNFNPAKSDNPFAYITQIVKFAFIRRIGKEKREHYIKIKNFENRFYDEYSSTSPNGAVEFTDSTQEFVKDFEKKVEEKRKKQAAAKANSVAQHFVKEDR